MSESTERRIARLEATVARMVEHFGPVVICSRQDAQGEPTQALSGGKVIAERKAGESTEQFWARVDGLAGPLPAGMRRTWLPDNGREGWSADRV